MLVRDGRFQIFFVCKVQQDFNTTLSGERKKHNVDLWIQKIFSPDFTLPMNIFYTTPCQMTILRNSLHRKMVQGRNVLNDKPFDMLIDPLTDARNLDNL